MQLDGVLALITGGGRGIGRGIADRFLEEGEHVAIAQRRPLDDELARHPRVHGLTADLTDAASLRGMVDAAAERLGGLDVLVNNAGMMSQQSPDELALEDWNRMLALNLTAPMFLSQAAVPHLRSRGGGAIISTGSVEGIGVNPEHAGYSATKAGVHGLMRALAVDLGPDGIRCNAIAPGWIETELSAGYTDEWPDPEEAERVLRELHPLRRTGTPRDIGDLAVFLASDASTFLTGQTLTVDGGRTVQLPLPRR